MTCHYYALVPAAGSGARFGSTVPKQYLELAGKPMVYHSLAALCLNERVACVWVVLSPDDLWWERYDWSGLGEKLHVLRCGGTSRAETVFSGLKAIGNSLSDEDWILVHDAARPCLSQDTLEVLYEELGDDPVGGILAVPVADTIKRADAKRRIVATESRERLWQAQTPQMFRYGLLCRALAENAITSDEAGAVEATGLQPRLVESDAMNFKVTYPADLRLAEMVLRGRKT